MKQNIDNKHVITHKDITSYKPDLELHRIMYLAELQKQRELANGSSTVVNERAGEVVEFPESSYTLELGKSYRLELVGGKIVFIKL